MAAKKGQLLPSSTRPPLLRKAAIPTMSSKATRNLISTHHTLLKEREKALKNGDRDRAKSIEAQIETNGGLKSYQLASKTGQLIQRGGDTSYVLVNWIKPHLEEWKKTSSKLRVLEIGALSTKNACSRVHSLDITRIDLNSQEPGIQQQDFMERPFPENIEDQFHLISLSLVLNYVPTASERGRMLRRCSVFLTDALPPESGLSTFPPYLFLVLPAPCINNSRYLTQEHLEDIMASLGFMLLKNKVTAKLIYQLWILIGVDQRRKKAFPKRILKPGKMKNNFAITLDIDVSNTI